MFPVSTPILLQKSKVAMVSIFGENLKPVGIDDSCSLNPATEVAYEFSVRRRGSLRILQKSHAYSLQNF